MYKITGFDIKSKNDEVLDYVDDKLEAIRLAKEYELCFEDGWTIRIEKINLKNKNNYENKSK